VVFHVTNFTESSDSYMSLEKLQRASLLMWEKLSALGVEDPKNVSAEDLSEAALNISTSVYESKFGRPLRPISELSELEQAVFMTNAISSNWFGLWALNAFPRVQMTHKFAAMMMATTISPKELAHVEAPWPSFLIDVPEGLLPLQGKDGVVSHITRIQIVSQLLPTVFKERWWGFWASGHAIEVLRAGPLHDAVTLRSGAELSKTALRKMPDQFERIDIQDLPLEEEFWEGYDRAQEDRVSVLIGRLVIGVCTLMTERANFTERTVKLSQDNLKYARRAGKQPESRLYTVGHPITLDCRPALQQYLNGTRPSRSPLTVQRLVAGHHKWQPHGPLSALRKWIFVEPYWQGKVDAPIPVRPHVAKDEP
jgi:hypothetical protein